MLSDVLSDNLLEEEQSNHKPLLPTHGIMQIKHLCTARSVLLGVYTYEYRKGMLMSENARADHDQD